MLLSAIIFSSANLSAEEEKKENSFRHLLIAGVNKAFNNSKINTPTAVIVYNYTRDDLPKDFYFEFFLNTISVNFILGLKNENYSILLVNWSRPYQCGSIHRTRDLKASTRHDYIEKKHFRIPSERSL